MTSPSAPASSAKRFRVALSFPGEKRDFVRKVAEALGKRFGTSKVLYDEYYEAEFARPNLATYLTKLYRDESDLIAVFLCADYERKEWTGLEWRAVLDMLKAKQTDALMYFRFDDADISGLLSIDGYVSIRDRKPQAIADLILQRLDLMNASQASQASQASPAAASASPAAIPKPVGTPAPPPTPTSTSAARPSKAVQLWQEKLDYFEEQLAILADPAQKYQVKQEIAEAKQKIKELSKP